MKTGSLELDSLFEYDNEVTMIYGEAASGKTTMAKLAAIQRARENKKVIFIDTENGFSIERFKQLCEGDHEKVMDNILVLKANNLNEQRRLVKDLVGIVETGKIGLIIIDSIGKHYRAELKQDDKYANRTMDESLRILKWAAGKKVPVIITNQVYSDMENNVKNVGGNMVMSACDKAIILSKNPRTLKIIKPEYKETRIDIKSDGIHIK